jgi:hypothetical protein
MSGSWGGEVTGCEMDLQNFVKAELAVCIKAWQAQFRSQDLGRSTEEFGSSSRSSLFFDTLPCFRATSTILKYSCETGLLMVSS